MAFDLLRIDVPLRMQPGLYTSMGKSVLQYKRLNDARLRPLGCLSPRALPTAPAAEQNV